MEDMFPILNIPKRSLNPIEYVPLDKVKPHEKQAIINHGQTLAQLARRGGLCWLELLFVLKDERYDYKMKITEEEAKIKALDIINKGET